MEYVSKDITIAIVEDDVKSWWKDHANQLPNVAFLMHQFLGISCSQIEIDFFKHCQHIDWFVADVGWVRKTWTSS